MFSFPGGATPVNPLASPVLVGDGSSASAASAAGLGDGSATVRPPVETGPEPNVALRHFIKKYPNYFAYQTRTAEGYERPAPTKFENVDVGLAHAASTRNTYTHRELYTTWEVAVSEFDVRVTSIDRFGNQSVESEELRMIESAQVQYNHPLKLDPAKAWFWLLNSCPSRYARSQPLFLLMVIFMWISVPVSFAAASSKETSEFLGAVSLFFIALILNALLVFWSILRDNDCCRCGKRARTEHRSRGNGCCAEIDWHETPPPPPRLGGSWYTSESARIDHDLQQQVLGNELGRGGHHDAAAALAARTLVEQQERARDDEEARLRGGGLCCRSWSRRSVIFLLIFLFGLVAALVSCAVAVTWTNFTGKSEDSEDECHYQAAQWWANFGCEDFSVAEYCDLETAPATPATDDAAAAPATDDGVPAVVTRVRQAASVSYTSPATGRRRLATPNEDLPYECAAYSVLDSVAASAVDGAPDVTCGLCKSAFLPSYRACEVLKFVYAVLLLVAACLGVTPMLPVHVFKYEPRPTCYVRFLGPGGVELMRANLGDPRNANAAVSFVYRQRRLLQLEYLRVGQAGAALLQPPALGIGGKNGVVSSVATTSTDTAEKVGRGLLKLAEVAAGFLM